MAKMLSRIRVLDLSRVFAGPFCTQMLADFGADVIKIERPGLGDEVRQQGSALRDAEGHEVDFTAPFVAMNRGKRSVTVDIATTEGQEILRALVLRSDVLVENFKVDDLRRFGLDYATLHALNPALIYCSITGFGQTGPRRAEPGYDLVFQAMSGIMSVTGPADGEPGAGPQRIGYSVSDITAAHNAVIAILGALYAREAGIAAGQHIDVALLDCQIAAASHIATSYLLTGQQPPRVGAASLFMAPYQPFECSDGALVILCGNDMQFTRLANALGAPELATDARFSTNAQRLRHRHELEALLAPRVRAGTRSVWTERLTLAGVPCAPINDFAHCFTDPQVVERGLVHHVKFAPTGTLPVIRNPLRLSETPPSLGRPPPALGEHTDEVCAELLGTTPERLRALRAAGIL